MQALAQVVAAAALALALAWFAVAVRGDTTIAVPPPASVAEQFARHVAARRYDRALQHLDSHSRITLTTVRLGGEALHARAGGINHVEGQSGAIVGEHAAASAVLTTRLAGQVRYVFQLVRRNGLWKINGWQEE